MRGFLVGSLGLVVLYAVVQNAENAVGGLGLVGAGLRSFLSATTAGVPDLATRASVRASAGAGAATTPTGPPVNPTVAAFTDVKSA